MNHRNAHPELQNSLAQLECWVEHADWKGYDTFDGLSSPYARILTLNRPLLKIIWQQGVRRFPLNLRPVLGIKPSTSSKGMGFFAQGYLGLYQASHKEAHLRKARFCLDWLEQHRCPQFRGHAWGNHFDYQSRGGNIAKGAPTIVWTGLIGHAFLDAYDALGEKQYADTAISACEFIINELGWMDMGNDILLRYYPGASNVIHNSNMIGASLLARAAGLSGNRRYQDLADKAVRFTLKHQTEKGAWYYGVGRKWEWVDSFHTGYVLESLHTYLRYSRNDTFQRQLEKGYRFFVETFFGSDGTPRYYDNKARPLDIQCASQGIQTLVNLAHLDPRSIAIAIKVAEWTIANMQDKSGYFYYRKYPLLTNKTPTLHWGQATMFAALAALIQHLAGGSLEPGAQATPSKGAASKPDARPG